MAKSPASARIPASQRRHISPRTKILLAVAAGGRCEFSGCNKYLFSHPLTLRGGNYSEHAHIYPFAEGGPRAGDGPQPDNIHDLENLMLLCQPCHKQVDDAPEMFPIELLQRYKREHEARIRHVTGLGPDLKTTVVQLRARVAGQAVDIPASDIFEAVAPRYPVDERGYVIDLTSLDDQMGDAYWKAAAHQIASEASRIYDVGMSVDVTRHISLFALAPIPLLVHFGRCLSNKVAVDFFQRHRTEAHPWVWKQDGKPAHFEWALLREGQDRGRVAIMLPLSGQLTLTDLPKEIDEQFFIYGLRLAGRAPGVDFLRQREDLDRFRIVYRELLAHLRATHHVNELHLLPAVPAPVAVCCGYDLLPKVDPTLIVYDNAMDQGGFIPRLRVNNHDR